MSAMYATSNTPGMNAFCPKGKKMQFSKLLYEQGAFLFIYIIETPEIIVPNDKKQSSLLFFAFLFCYFTIRQCKRT